MKAKSKIRSSIAILCALALVMGAVSMLFACNDKNGISFAESEVTLYVADTVKLDYTVSPEDAEITWESSNKKVATVNRKGAVTGVAKGSAVITATLADGTSATCAVTVLDRTVTISQTTAEIDLSQGNTLTLTASSSDNGDITWTSSDTNVATVNGGVVTFGKATAQVTEVTITAQRGAAKASCKITVTDPRIPDDYYLLVKGTKAEVCALPNTWFYHADGAESTNYRFADGGKPAFGGAKLDATLDIYPSYEDKSSGNGKYFRFRYQPAFDKQDGGEETGDTTFVPVKYTAKFTVKINKACTLKYGKESNPASSEIKANVAKSIVYVGETDAANPFGINISKFTDIAPADAGTVSFEITNILFKEYEEGDENDVIVDIPDEPIPETYDLVRGTASDTCGYTGMGKWFYMIDPQNNTSDFTEAKYNNGTVTLAMKEALQGKYHQIRIQPRVQPGTRVEATFTVSLDAPGKVTFGRNNPTSERTAVVFGTELTPEDEADGVELVAVGTEKTYKKVFVVTDGNPFVIAVVPDGWSDDEKVPSTNVATVMTVKDVTFTEKPLENFTVTFDAKGGDAVNSQTVKEGSALETLPTPTRSGGYTFLGWYESESYAGAALVAPYTPDGNVTLYAKWADPSEQLITVSYEANGGSAVASQSITGGSSVTLPTTARTGYVFDGWYEDSSFGGSKLEGTYTPAATITLYAKWLKEHTVTFNTNNYGKTVAAKKAVDGNSVALETLSRVGYDFGGWFDNAECTGTAVGETYTPSTDKTLYAKWTAKTEYNITVGGYGPVTANRDAWYYTFHGTQSGAAASVATFANDTITFDVTGAKHIAKESKSDNLVQLRYLPNLADGTNYEISFKYTASVDGRLWVGRNDIGEWHDVVANTAVDITYNTKVEQKAGANPIEYRVLIIGFHPSADGDVNITMSDIACSEAAKPEIPATYGLENVTNGTVCANPGKWYCNYPGDKATCDTAGTKYDNGVITFAFTNIVGADNNNYQLRFQPDMAVGSKYTITFKFKLSAAGRILYSSEYKNSNDSHGGQPMAADEELQITYTGTVSASAPFMIQIKGVLDGAVTLTVWDISVVAAA